VTQWRISSSATRGSSESAVFTTIPTYTKSPAVARIADRPGCQWPSRLSKVNDFHFILSERAYTTFYYWLIVTLAVSLTVSEIWPIFRWKTHIFYSFH